MAARLKAACWLPTLGPFSSFGQRWVVRTTDPALAAFLDHVYTPLRSSGTGQGAVVYCVLAPTSDSPGLVCRDGDLVGAPTRTPASTLGRLVWAINRQVIERSLDRLIFHAAAAAVGETAVMLPAPMEAGKTTLVAGLLQRGFDYLTDEATAVGPDLTATGYLKPLSVDPGSWEVLPQLAPAPDDDLAPYLTQQWQVSALDIGATRTSARLGLIVFPRYEKGAGVDLKPVSGGEAVRLAATSTFVPEGELIRRWRVERIAAMVREVPTFILISDDLRGASEAIADIVPAGPAQRTPSLRRPKMDGRARLRMST